MSEAMLVTLVIVVVLILIGVLTFTTSVGFMGNKQDGVKGQMKLGFQLNNPMREGYEPGEGPNPYLSHYNPLAFDRDGYKARAGTLGGGFQEREVPGWAATTSFTPPSFLTKRGYMNQ